MRAQTKTPMLPEWVTHLLRDVLSATALSPAFALAFVLLMAASASLGAQGPVQMAAKGQALKEALAAESDKDGRNGFAAAEHAVTCSVAGRTAEARNKLIVVGFVGGRVRANDTVHREVQLSRSLQEQHAPLLDSFIFANRDGERALQTILRTLDRDQDGNLSANERRCARIILFGHSWGASEAIALARRLNQLGIPVLLTIQVDSVPKPGQDDRSIPPNVHNAVNFYQNDGLLRGRSRIVAANPERTAILGNFRFSYRDRRVLCTGFPWYAQLFMHRHIQIENDPAVWDRVEALIVERIG